jgi:pyridoxine 5-phosphate synthase
LPAATIQAEEGFMVRLLINVDHVATIRQQRDTVYPDPVVASGLCELAGADGITIHLREDRRHAQERDVRILRQTVRGSLNLEMAVVPAIIDIATEVKPDMCTLVPEKREERTTEGGLDLRGRAAEIGKAVRRLRDAGIAVSLFIDPDEDSARACVDLGAVQAELHTGYYCHTKEGSAEAERELARLEKAGRIVVDTGLRLAAGHGLDYGNVGPVAALGGVEEMSIGHAIVARAIMVGMDRAVRDMREAIDRGVRAAHRE